MYSCSVQDVNERKQGEGHIRNPEIFANLSPSILVSVIIWCCTQLIAMLAPFYLQLSLGLLLCCCWVILNRRITRTLTGFMGIVPGIEVEDSLASWCKATAELCLLYKIGSIPVLPPIPTPHPHPLLLRAYFWLCTQRSQRCSCDLIGCQGLNLVSSIQHPLYYLFAASHPIYLLRC